MAGFVAFLLVSMTSCDKDDLGDKTELIGSDYKNMELKSGFSDNGIAIHAKQWSVIYVKDAATGELLKDTTGKQIMLDAVGRVEVLGSWLKLEKKEDDNLLTISLKENLNTNSRRLLIGILADGNQDEISFVQSRGDGYEIVKKEIIEIPGSRREYTSDEGCYPITLSNNSGVAKYMETSAIYKDINYVSEFTSSDLDAFKWVNSADSLIFMGEILKEGMVYWSKQVPYKQGLSLEPYIKLSDKAQLLVQPHSNVQLRGEVEYLERECHYTFTIKNQSSGHQFDISGTWKQKVPLSTITHML